MLIFRGKGVCGGAAVGTAAVFRRKDIQVKRYRVDNVQTELERLLKAEKEAVRQLDEIYRKAVSEAGEESAEIFEIHAMMVEDQDYNDHIREMISTQNVNAEYAVACAGDSFSEMFAEMDDPYMQARSADVKDISNRIIMCLSGSESLFEMPEGKVIICAEDLAPSETVTLDKSRVLAFVTAYGSSNSHTAILARTMNIPAVIGVGEEFLSHVKNGMTAAADGYTGEFMLEPDKEAVARLNEKIQQDREQSKLLLELKGRENVTLDGRRVKIYANIGSVDSVEDVLYNDAGGIGLFRSEFLYLESSDYPDEEAQFSVYRRVLESMEGRKVIIRTLDIGADKQADYFRLEKEENPALGLRGARLCIQRPHIFKTQLRALYRASAYGNLAVMFPMIASVWELEECLAVCEQVRNELKNEGTAFSDSVELGVMIETPAAAVISDILAPMADFFSVGTNDLTQYTLACDRQNRHVERFCDTHHEAVLRLIKFTAENAHKHGKWIGICGELAADTSLTEEFLQMGIDELSVSPSYVLKVRDKVRKCDLSV